MCSYILVFKTVETQFFHCCCVLVLALQTHILSIVYIFLVALKQNCMVGTFKATIISWFHMNPGDLHMDGDLDRTVDRTPRGRQADVSF